MNIKFLSKAIAPLAAVAALSMAAPASAFTFNAGDKLAFAGGYKAPAPLGLFEFESNQDLNANGNFSDDFAAVGTYGNFGVENSSTGAFSVFSNAGTVIDGYKILSLNFSDPSTYVKMPSIPFLKLDNGKGDTFTFEITAPAEVIGVPLRNGLITGVSYDGIFKSASSKFLGKGTLSAQFTTGGTNESYSASIIVQPTSVPEPSALLGIGLMVGAVYVIRRRQVAIS